MDQVICLSIITASIAFTLSETKLFLPFRDWVSARSKFLGKLVNCGYCTGHWIAFALVAIYKPQFFQCCVLFDYFLTAIAIAWLGAFQWILMCLLIKEAEK